jgi:hemoglobin
MFNQVSWRNLAIGLISDEATMTEDLYELIGGRGTIKTATELFYRKLLEDDKLRRFFERVDIHDAHGWSRDHGLNDAHFDLFLKHFRAALEQAGVKPENAEKVMQRLENKRSTVLDK